MAKKPPTKYSTETPEISFKVEKVPLESVRAFLRQLEITGREYPDLLTHVLMMWPEVGANAPSARARFCQVFDDETTNLCQVWKDMPGHRYKSGFVTTHFLYLRGACNKTNLTLRFSRLFYPAGRILADQDLATCIGLSDEVQGLENPEERSLLALHEWKTVVGDDEDSLHDPSIIVCDWTRHIRLSDVMQQSTTIQTFDQWLLGLEQPEREKTLYPGPLHQIAHIVIDLMYSARVKKLLPDWEFHYFGIIPDVLAASSLFYARVLDLAEEQTQNQGRLLKTQQPTEAGSGKTDDIPVTLREFIREHCQSLSDNLLDGHTKALQRLDQREQIELKNTGQWTTGQSKKYLSRYLIEHWPIYKEKRQTLPNLKDLPLS